MVQTVRANDEYASPMFRWDKANKILSMPHEKDIWFYGLDENNDFICLRKEPKPKPPPKCGKHHRTT